MYKDKGDKNMKEKKEINRFAKAGVFGVLAVGLVAALLMTSYIGEPVVEQTIIAKTWHGPLVVGDPAGDASGFCMFSTYPNQAVPATAYATNLTTGNCYEYYTAALSGEATGETPHSTAFDYVVKIRVNDTVGYNTTSSAWEPSWTFLNISVNYDFGTDISWTQMTLVEVTNNSNFCWYQGYINNGGAGYTLSQNQKFNASVNHTQYY